MGNQLNMPKTESRKEAIRRNVHCRRAVAHLALEDALAEINTVDMQAWFARDGQVHRPTQRAVKDALATAFEAVDAKTGLRMKDIKRALITTACHAGLEDPSANQATRRANREYWSGVASLYRRGWLNCRPGGSGLEWLTQAARRNIAPMNWQRAAFGAEHPPDVLPAAEQDAADLAFLNELDAEPGELLN